MLERALRDRRKDVRQAALGLIRRLPDSDFAQRWSGRARQIVRPVADRIVVRELRTVDADWIADGFEPRPPRGVGETAWMLTQTLSFAPPAIWPQGMLAHVLASDWAQPLVQGLSQAAASYADAEWCEALLLAWTQAAARDQLWPIEPDRLLAGLPPERAERVLVQALYDTPRVTAGLLARRQVAWSEGFSRYVVQHSAAPGQAVGVCSHRAAGRGRAAARSRRPAAARRRGGRSIEANWSCPAERVGRTLPGAIDGARATRRHRSPCRPEILDGREIPRAHAHGSLGSR